MYEDGTCLMEHAVPLVRVDATGAQDSVFGAEDIEPEGCCAGPPLRNTSGSSPAGVETDALISAHLPISFFRFGEKRITISYIVKTTLAKSGIGMKGGVSQFKFTSARNTVNSAVDCDNHLSSKVRNILIRKWGIEAN
jgi:hypothetical protein